MVWPVPEPESVGVGTGGLKKLLLPDRFVSINTIVLKVVTVALGKDPKSSTEGTI